MTCVLVVDDEDDVRTLMRMILERSGIQVIEAPSGKTVPALLAGHPVDVMVLDLRLPEIDGWEVLAGAREAGLLDRRGVVVVSAQIDPGTAARAEAAGCQGWLRKPFRPEELVAAVRSADPGAAA